MKLNAIERAAINNPARADISTTVKQHGSGALPEGRSQANTSLKSAAGVALVSR